MTEMTRTTDCGVMERLIQQLTHLPGIGRRSAHRVVFYLLKQPREDAQALADSISQMTQTVQQCSVCYHFSESDPCMICSDPRRDQQKLLVVEEPKDVLSFEQSGAYNGVYHVLMGRLVPLDGIGPGELTVKPLLDRVKQSGVKEVILGTSPSLEGDGTALHLAQELKRHKVNVTRLARGMPTGAPLDTVSKAVLGDAIHGRRRLDR